MAEPTKDAPAANAKAPEKTEKPADREFRRRAALALLGGYVQRNGGFGDGPEVQEIFMRQVWGYADSFVKTEGMEALPARPSYDQPPPAQARQRARPASPSDEWAVIDGDRQHRGFIIRAEAEAFAAERRGARVVQVSGPDTEALVARAS